jgi:hypothetical protein
MSNLYLNMEANQINQQFRESIRNGQFWSSLELLRGAPKYYNPMALDTIKDQTDELVWTAIKYNPLNIKFMRKQTLEMCKYTAQYRFESLEYIDEEFKTSEICSLAVRAYCPNIRYVPYHLLTREMCFDAVKQYGNTLSIVRKFRYDYDICRCAVNQHATNIRYVPHDLPEYDLLCKEAVAINGLAYECTKYYNTNPDQKITELMRMSMQHNLASVPLDLFNNIPELRDEHYRWKYATGRVE